MKLTALDAIAILNEGQEYIGSGVTVTTSQDGDHFLVKVAGEVLGLSIPACLPKLGKGGKPEGYTHMLNIETRDTIRRILGVPDAAASLELLTGVYRDGVFRFFCPDDRVTQVAIAIDCKQGTGDEVFYDFEGRLRKLTAVFYAKWYPPRLVDGQLLCPHGCFIIDTPREFRGLLRPGLNSMARFGGRAA